VIIDANPIPAVTVRPGESLRYKNRELYVNANDKIVIYGSCASASAVRQLLWRITDVMGNPVDMGYNNSEWYPLGNSQQDFVMLGDSGLLSPGGSVSRIFGCSVALA
jgi:hypothetical protein